MSVSYGNFPYLERIQGVLDGVQRGSVEPPGPLELAALRGARVRVRGRRLVPDRLLRQAGAVLPPEVLRSGGARESGSARVPVPSFGGRGAKTQRRAEHVQKSGKEKG